MLRRFIAISALTCLVMAGNGLAQAAGALHAPGFDMQIADKHRQLYGMSCIPMSIELVLKLSGRVPSGFYGLQEAWKNKSNGNFRDFDGRTIEGIALHKRFGMARGARFPIARLFNTIDRELKSGRYVVVSLPNS